MFCVNRKGMRMRKRSVSKKRQQSKRHRKGTRRQRGGSTKEVLFKLTNNAGFGSTFGFMLQTYIYAKKHGYPFKVKSENWQYGPEKGWHEFFTTLNVVKDEGNTLNQESYGHGSGPPEKYSLGEYHNAIEEIYKPIEEVQKKAGDFIQQIGGPYVSLYVRRGDKTFGPGKEMEAADLSTIMKDTGIQNGNLYVMTDDYRVVDEIKRLLPNVRVFSNTDPASKGFSIFKSREADIATKKKEALELFTSIEIFNRGEKGWADNRSNMGRFLKMRGLDKVTLYPSSGTVTNDTIIDPPYSPF